MTPTEIKILLEKFIAREDRYLNEAYDREDTGDIEYYSGRANILQEVLTHINSKE